MSWLDKIFGGDLVKDVMSGIDKLFTSDKERLDAEHKIREIILKKKQESEQMYLNDRASARDREVKSKDNKLMYVVGYGIFGAWFFALGSVLFFNIAQDKMQLITHAMGIIEGGVLAIVGYYFGSSKNNT